MKILITILFILVSYRCLGQRYHTCYVYQYEGNDSNKKKLVLTQEFNELGKIVYEQYNDYKSGTSDEYSIWPNDTTYYHYKGSVLIFKKEKLFNGDSTITQFFYDKYGREVKRKIFSYALKLLIENDSILILDTPRLWIDSILFLYNKAGNLIETRQTVGPGTGKTAGLPNIKRETWKYNFHKKVKCHKAFEDSSNKLIYTSHLKYRKNRFTVRMKGYVSQNDKMIFILDSKKRTVKKIFIGYRNSNGYKLSTSYTVRISYLFDEFIQKEEWFDENQKLNLTHIYVYK